VAAPAPRSELGAAGMPGGERIGYAENLGKGQFGMGFSAGFGMRKNLLNKIGIPGDHRYYRGSASAALSYALSDSFSLGLAVVGWLDKHYGIENDDGWVGEPRLTARFARSMGSLSLGAQVTVWVPGKDAPSVAIGATSVDGRLLLSGRAGKVHYGLNAGGKFNNSAKSVDDPAQLSAADQTSLGVSDWHSLVGGARLALGLGKLTVGAEAETNFYVGSGAPGLSLVAQLAGYYDLTSALTAQVFVATSYFPEPEMGGAIELLPYEPRLSFGLAVQARFGGGGVKGPKKVECRQCGCPGVEEVDGVPCVAPFVEGIVTDADTSSPLAGVTVTLSANGAELTTTTDEAGRYSTENVEGAVFKKGTKVQISYSLERFDTKVVDHTVVNGRNERDPISLKPAIPPGQMKFLIRSFSGQGLVAKITVSPGDYRVTTGPDGKYDLEVPPGTYQVTVNAPGYQEQVKTYVIAPNGVQGALIDLRKK
jgi:hypothetical protein